MGVATGNQTGPLFPGEPDIIDIGSLHDDPASPVNGRDVERACAVIGMSAARRMAHIAAGRSVD